VTKLQPVPGPRYAGNLPRKPRLPSLSPCTGSRLPGLTRQGGKHTLQRPKTTTRRRRRSLFVFSGSKIMILSQTVIEGPRAPAVKLTARHSMTRVCCPVSVVGLTPARGVSGASFPSRGPANTHPSVPDLPSPLHSTSPGAQSTPPSPNPLPAAPHSARVVCQAIANPPKH